MFNSNCYLNDLRPDLDFRVGPCILEPEEELLQNFGSSMLDDHHGIANLSLPQISLNDSRSASPDMRLTTYDRIFDNPNGLLSPKMGSSALIGF